MKSFSVFSKVFIGAVVWTVVFLGIAGYASQEAYKADPALITKLEEKYNVSVHIGGISKRDTSKEVAEDIWNLAPPASKFSIKTFNGDVRIKKTMNKEVVIKATGRLDVNKAPRLLAVTETADVLEIRQPDDNAVTKLEVTIEIPDSFSKELRFESASGELTLENLKLDSLIVKTVSGEVTGRQIDVKDVDAVTVSGDIKIESSTLSKVVGKSVSGDIEVSNTAPANVSFSSVSGDVKLKMAKADDVHFSLQSTSGEIHNAFGSANNGKFDVTVKTTSGDIEIE
ncbi:DUF4097 family beta strand repeat-containing protein [Bdellovibrio sp. 22V]|uniref:DUF4097 family beta strand repeat-containing protein n=1 Tax=Bdellovibrio sp. 22V TaxID=3044166 RepID=UPI002543B7D0|nr:DUF4097 family beta strand repeat-containing protein [Bdellovibrio sp. 22V]WII72512.1 DUF4097 family beta strand repeat-containing protein [Bdellovibrio sp. 22V]